MSMTKSYSELIKLPTFQERFKYCQTNQHVGDDTFGHLRYLNQKFYHSYEWRKIIRPKVILRDNGNDLACDGYPIHDHIYIHHLNPINAADLVERCELVLLLDNLVCCSFDTHNNLHYGYAPTKAEYVARKPNDTAPWLLEA